MSHRREDDNPWNNKSRKAKFLSNNRIQDDKSNSAEKKSGEVKFKEAQQKLQQMVQKHLDNKEDSSSEEEDELETDNILGSVLKIYSQVGGRNEDLAKTQNFLENTFHSGSAVCLICIATVKRNDQIWSCGSCYGFFHLFCIQRWAKDSIAHQKLAADERPDLKRIKYNWQCPKCRKDYDSAEIPSKYVCFCSQKVDPEFQPWLVPHSCGDTCNRPLVPDCGHRCLLLCHPGPCPPCPKMVQATCYCKRSDKKTVRCSKKEWSCGQVCGQKLDCGNHTCSSFCHYGPCPPCDRSSYLKCICGCKTDLKPCAQITWQCDKVCGKKLSCGDHNCEVVCHTGACGPCPRSLPRECPCSQEVFQLPCNEEVPTCGGTCSKLLDCGLHSCTQRCHRGPCGQCMEITLKKCRCGLFSKEIPCQKPYLCETKCKKFRDCYVHLCNRKCCDSNCPPCEKPCGKTLPCGQHKCSSVCHRGPCYPCTLTKQLSCRCGMTQITVPCGAAKRASPPKCTKPCRIEPECHHDKREFHRCHFGDCPRCRLPCGKARDCGHSCTETCHSAVLLPKEGYKAATPWEKVNMPYEVKSIPCPECVFPVQVPCLGGHRLLTLPCHKAISQPCGDPCARPLSCGNHSCSLLCHTVTSDEDCEECTEDCVLERSCVHPCPLSCHPPPCEPCNQMMRIKCHCGITQLYIKCRDWISAEDKTPFQSCGNQCPRNYSCGHRCSKTCHPGECPNDVLCRKRIKVHCPCKRIKKELVCHVAKENPVLCGEICQSLKSDRILKEEKEKEEARIAEERRNREELEKFEKKLHGGKRNRERRKMVREDKESWISNYKYLILGTVFLLLSVISAYLLLN